MKARKFDKQKFEMFKSIYLRCSKAVSSILLNASYIVNLIGGQDPVVQSVVSLTSSLRVISLTILADSMYNILIFFAEKNVSSFCTAKATHIFSAKNFNIFAYHLV